MKKIKFKTYKLSSNNVNWPTLFDISVITFIEKANKALKYSWPTNQLIANNELVKEVKKS
jgi:hypothetical protein